MDALRRSKSATAMGGKSDGVEISELTATYPDSGKTTPSFLQVELVSEPGDGSSTKSSRAGSFLIEEYIEDEDKSFEDDVQVREFQVESAESSDDVSQYLDKEERGPGSSKVIERHVDDTEREDLNEGTDPKKRKLSADSSRSKYSLSNLDVIKKIREAKTKIKVPKLTFATRKTARKGSPPIESKKPKKEPKTKKNQENIKPKKDEKPVYIHIPLKPPPGESDEFSHLEDGAKQPETEVKEEDKKPTEEPAEEKPPENEIKEEDKKTTEELPEETPKRKATVTRKPPLKINPAFKQLLKDVRKLKEKENAQSIESEKEPPKNVDVEKPESPEDKIDTPEAPTEVLDVEKPEEAEQAQSSDVESTKEDPFDRLFQARTENPEEPTPETSRGVRSKSAEPERKRKSSIDSSYSRKSLSKLGIMKKLKEASEKIRSTLSLSSLKKSDSKKVKKEETKKPKKPKLTAAAKTGVYEPPKPVQPVYIHIPLKPPEGQTDEFSHLEFESGAQKTEPDQPEAVKEERTDSLDSMSPISTQNDDIHFIFLTPPSDDEFLDQKVSEIPETPSSEEMVFFGSLKKLAEKVVDDVSPETKRKTLETVSEENGGSSEKSSTNDLESLVPKPEEAEDAKPEITKDTEVIEEEIQQTVEESSEEPTVQTQDVEKMVVDEEDGLNEPTKSEELKSLLKSEGSGLKKKVSFKKKSKKQEDKTSQDNGYEPIGVPKEEGETSVETELEDKKKVLVSDINQSMSVDEEKSYLDQKIVKDTSLEEDYNKWSKSGDHEYELINPPSDEVIVSPAVTVIDTNHEPRVVISATEILDDPAAGRGRKKSFFDFGRFHKEKTATDAEVQGRSRRDSSMEHLEDDQHEKTEEGPNKIQAAFRHTTDQLKTKTSELCTKMKNIKKPHINMPKAPEFKKPQFKKPDFKKFKIEKPNFHLPKIPDTATIHLPNFGLKGSKKVIEKETIETRQHSTESNVGDTETKKKSKFDFSGTFPRFKKKKQPEASETAFGTVPRTKKHQEYQQSQTTDESVRVPLHSEDSEDRWESETENIPPRTSYEDRETSTDIERSSHGRFSKDIAIEDEYERENQEINRAEFLNRWQHGNFAKDDDVDREDERIVGQLVEERFKRVGQRYGKHDEPKYIDEEDIEEYYNSRPNRELITDLDNLDEDENNQIKDGYSSEGSVSLQKKGRLGKLDIDSDEFFVVHEIREGFQTPANALAQMNEYDPIGSNRSLPQQVIEKRPPIKKPKRRKTPHVSQERIPGDEESLEGVVPPPSRPKRRSKKGRRRVEDVIVPYQETINLEEAPRGQRLNFPRESLGILGDDERDDRDFEEYDDKSKESSALREIEDLTEEPSIPPRKHRSLKSLTTSETEFILPDTNRNVSIEDYVVSTQAPPKRPGRRSHSRTSSLSRVSLPPSQRDADSLLADESYLLENQPIPSYLIENQYQNKYNPELQQSPSYIQQNKPCVEEPCIQDIRDYMGYAIVDKTKPPREPPLPPPRTPSRRRKRQVEQKFATMPHKGTPTRPLRNYSTIGHSNGKGNKENLYENDGENKENEIDITQYMEIEDDINRDLISGEVVQKMRQRPLPAPPRPPRKPRTFRKSLQDITSKENIAFSSETSAPFKSSYANQTESIPPEYSPDNVRESPRISAERSGEEQTNQDYSRRETRLITPSVYSYQETVTHGSLIVEPLNGAKVIPDSQLSSRERLVPVTKEFSDEETSEIPESFKALRNPETNERLQIQDLDVDRLRVNEVLANRIVVSELDAHSILTDDIQDRSGGPALRVGDIQLPQKLLEEVMRKLEEHEQKKTSPQELNPLNPPQLSPNLPESSPEPPQPPPRGYESQETPLAQSRSDQEASSENVLPRVVRGEMLEPEVDDEPPPRPPEPVEGMYAPSQPPASFYALRAKQYVDGVEGENIPTVPRRKRRHRSRSRPMSRSRSTSDDSDLAQARSHRSSRRVSEPSISELTGRLAFACGSRAQNALKRLIYNVSENLLQNADGQQDMHVIIVILLVLIAGLILLGFGQDRTVTHLHHWEYFNPPKDI
ncbi:titin isoform X2 [Sitophilus oryzae]|nr:titin isoform X2 [Sitophilus oryzae]